MKLRIRFEYDPDPDFSWLGQWNTPETYAGNEVLDATGRPLPFEDYIRYQGNPDCHIALQAQVESQCECCGSWVGQISLGGIDFMDDDKYFVGTVAEEELYTLEGTYCFDVARDLFAETEENLR